MVWRALALVFAAWAAVLIAPEALAQPATPAPDLCAQARADWPSVQRSTNVALVQTYLDGLPPECGTQRTQAEARLQELGGAPSGRARIRYTCNTSETIRVTYDYRARTAVLWRYARQSVHLSRVESPTGFRYVRGDRVSIEGRGSNLRVVYANGERLRCSAR